VPDSGFDVIRGRPSRGPVGIAPATHTLTFSASAILIEHFGSSIRSTASSRASPFGAIF